MNFIGKQPKSIEELIQGIRNLPKPIRKYLVTDFRNPADIQRPVKSFLPQLSSNEEVILIAIAFPKQK